MKSEEKNVLKLLQIDETFLQKKAVGLSAQQVVLSLDKSTSFFNQKSFLFCRKQAKKHCYVFILQSCCMIYSKTKAFMMWPNFGINLVEQFKLFTHKLHHMQHRYSILVK